MGLLIHKRTSGVQALVCGLGDVVAHIKIGLTVSCTLPQDRLSVVGGSPYQTAKLTRKAVAVNSLAAIPATTRRVAALSSERTEYGAGNVGVELAGLSSNESETAHISDGG